MWLKRLFRGRRKGIGLALGGGGVRGLAHIPYLETLDELGIKPVALAGTSMGAIMGALYASGMTGAQIRKTVRENIITEDDGIRDVLKKRGAILRWLGAVKPSWSPRGMLRADGLVNDLLDMMEAETFQDLKIPLSIMATDFRTGEPVVFHEGDLLTAIKASMAIPGVFVPVEHRGRILVDGGVVNNLPYDILRESCGYTIAVDVCPRTHQGDAEPPNMLEATVGMFDMLIGRITDQMMQQNPPDLYANPEITGVRILEFDKAGKVLRQADAAVGTFRSQAARLSG